MRDDLLRVYEQARKTTILSFNRRLPISSVGRAPVCRAVDPGGVANLYGLWDWVGIARTSHGTRSCTFPLGRLVSRKAGK